jgi:MFS superfamily sulfate permease-like transporter
MLLTHNLAVGLISGVALACILLSRKVAKLIASSASARSAPMPALKSCYTRGTAI